MKQLYLIIILSFSQINIFAQINCEFLIWSNLGTEKISTMGDNVHFSNAESELPFQVYDGQIYYLNKSRLSIYKSDLEGNLSDTIFLDSDLP